MNTSSVPGRARARASTILSVCVAFAAFSFVIYMVPFREHCVDPDAPALKIAISRTADGCTLLGHGAARTLSRESCATLACEPGLGTTLVRANPLALVVLFAMYIGGSFAWSVRWFLLVRLGGLRLSLLRVWRVTLEAQAGGILLPGGVAGDALRVGAAVGHGALPSVVVASVLLDRVAGLVTLAGTAAAISLVVAGFAPSTRASTFVLAAIPVAFGISLAVIRAVGNSASLQRGMASPRPHVQRLLGLLRPPLDYVLSRGAPRAIGGALVASAVVSLVQLGVIRGIVAALGVTPTTESWVYMGSAMTFMVAALPALPGAWGTADAAFVFFLAKAGIGADVAFAVSLVYRSFWYLSGMIGACLHLMKATAGDSPPRTQP